MIEFSIILLLPLSLVFVIVIKNYKKYKYSPAQSSLYEKYDLENNKLTELKIENNTLDLSHIDSVYDTLFLKISLQPSLLSYIFEPYFLIDEEKHYFEYGAKGTRYVNVSRLAGKKVHIKNFYIRYLKTDISLYGYKNNIDPDKKILILAPHADDAEIAAFGLYKSAKNVTIVTLTLGENGVCKYCDLYPSKLEAAIKKAEMRSFDALTTGILGNVDMSRSLMLGYPGGSLKKMAQHKNDTITSEIDNFPTNKYRQVSHTKFNLPKQHEVKYENFYNDIKTIVDELRPDIIISPHPQIDSNPDHQQTTITLFEVLKELQVAQKLLLYTNHLPTSELYPHGSIFSSVSLPPVTQSFEFDSIYSFNLDKSLQKDKYFALESMHDLRDSLLPISLKNSYHHFIKMMFKKFYTKDKSYFRRAVRSNELFFILLPKKGPTNEKNS